VNNLKKIRGEFLSEREADTAIEKISPHCYNIKIIYNNNYDTSYDGGYFDSIEPNFYDYSIMSGINTGWSLNPYGSYNFEHTRSNNYLSSIGLGKSSGKTILEADVSPDKYELVKERLYSLGALSVN
jgi:hypothetical protein